MGRGEGAECLEAAEISRAAAPESGERGLRAKLQGARDKVSEFFVTRFGLSSKERVFLAGALLTAPVTAVAGVGLGLGVAAATAAPHLWQRAKRGQVDAAREWEEELSKRERKRAERAHKKRLKTDLIYQLNHDIQNQSANADLTAREELQRALSVYLNQIGVDSEEGSAALALAASLERGEGTHIDEAEADAHEEREAALEAEREAALEAERHPASPLAESLKTLCSLSDKELTEIRRGPIQAASEELLKMRELEGDHSDEISAVVTPLVAETAVTFYPRWKEKNEEMLRAFDVISDDQGFSDLTSGADQSDEFYQTAHQLSSGWCVRQAEKGDKMTYQYLSEFVGYGYRDAFGLALRDRFLDEVSGDKEPRMLQKIITPEVRERAIAKHGEGWADLMTEPYFWCSLIAQTNKEAPGKKAKKSLTEKQRASIVMRTLDRLASIRDRHQRREAAQASA